MTAIMSKDISKVAFRSIHLLKSSSSSNFLSSLKSTGNCATHPQLQCRIATFKSRRGLVWMPSLRLSSLMQGTLVSQRLTFPSA